MELTRLVEDLYPVGRVRRCRFLGPGMNDHYAVEADEGSFVLRIYRAGERTPASVAFELAAIRHLDAAGVGVAPPVPRADGRDLTTIDAPEGMRVCVLFERAPGTETTSDPRFAELYGDAAAKLHSAGDTFAAPPGREPLDVEVLFESPLDALLAGLEQRPSDARFVAALAAHVADGVAALPSHELDRGLCHGDLHGGNACVDGRVLTFFDFDFCGIGCRAYDLATFRRKCMLHHGDGGRAAWEAFLRGYTATRPFDPRTHAAIELFVVVRQLWILGMQAAAHDFLGVGWWLSDGYLEPRLALLRRAARAVGFAAEGA